MANVLIQNLVSNEDTFQASFIAPAVLHNGDPIVMGALSTTAGQKDCHTCTKPVGKTVGIWMAYDPEVNVTDGKYKGLDPDPRNYSIASGSVFQGFKPQVEDILTFTQIGEDTYASGDTHVVIDATGKLVFATAAATDTFCALIEKVTYVSIGNGSLGDTQRVTAYQLRVVNN